MIFRNLSILKPIVYRILDVCITIPNLEYAAIMVEQKRSFKKLQDADIGYGLQDQKS